MKNRTIFCLKYRQTSDENWWVQVRDAHFDLMGNYRLDEAGQQALQNSLPKGTVLLTYLRDMEPSNIKRVEI